MIIRSQDKKSIINFDNCKEIRSRMIYENDGTVCEISADRITLGIYADEEKAIKVLDMIQSAYERYKMFAITYQDGMMQKLEKCHGLDEARELISSVFQMPQDSEV